MRAYTTMQVDEAVAYAAAGGVALHLHTIIVHRDRAPRCFVAAVDRGEWIAHLFGQNEHELRAIATQLGVRVIVVERRGKPGQHIDLCGRPLRRAIDLCENADTTPTRPPWREREEDTPAATLFDCLEERTP